MKDFNCSAFGWHNLGHVMPHFVFIYHLRFERVKLQLIKANINMYRHFFFMHFKAQEDYPIKKTFFTRTTL